MISSFVEVEMAPFLGTRSLTAATVLGANMESGFLNSLALTQKLLCSSPSRFPGFSKSGPELFLLCKQLVKGKDKLPIYVRCSSISACIPNEGLNGLSSGCPV